jgi:quaternary ammonium compound-resistance protein SugE
VNGWALLLGASVFEVKFSLATDASDGFTRPGPSAIAILSVTAAVVCLSWALREIDVAVGYSVWVGVGTVGTTLAAAALFDQHIGLAEAACLALIVAGVIGLRLADAEPPPAADEE